MTTYPFSFDLPAEISSKRLLLRPYRPGDGAMYFHMLQENRKHLYEFLPPSLMAVRSAEDAEAVILDLMAKWQNAAGSPTRAGCASATARRPATWWISSGTGCCERSS